MTVKLWGGLSKEDVDNLKEFSVAIEKDIDCKIQNRCYKNYLI
jgi:hypothetical protein